MPVLKRRIAGRNIMSGFSEMQAAWPSPGDIRQGLALSVVDKVLQEGDLSAAELDRLAFPRKTLAHRRLLGSLSPEQSDRLTRILRVISEAEEMFGARDKARLWLRRPNQALGGEAPLELLDTDTGTRQVETLLLRIGHGISA